MLRTYYPLLHRHGWSCLSHKVSTSVDILNQRTSSEKPLFIEFFAGSHGISDVAKSAGYKTWTTDINEKFTPDLVIDILNLRKNQVPSCPCIIWASIPCTVFSIMSLAHHWQSHSIGYRQYYYTPKTREAIAALRILNKTLNLIKVLKPIYYFIENPRGALRHFGHVKMIPFRHTVSYSDYGLDYYKPTNLWTNFSGLRLKKITGCVGNSLPGSVIDLGNNFERSKVPGVLIESILNQLPF